MATIGKLRGAVIVLWLCCGIGCQTSLLPTATGNRLPGDSRKDEIRSVSDELARSRAARERARKRMHWFAERYRHSSAGDFINGFVTGAWWLDHYVHDRDTYFVVECRNIFMEAGLVKLGDDAREVLSRYRNDERVICSSPSGPFTTVGALCQNLLERLRMIEEGDDMEESWKSFFARVYGQAYCRELLSGTGAEQDASGSGTDAVK